MQPHYPPHSRQQAFFTALKHFVQARPWLSKPARQLLHHLPVLKRWLGTRTNPVSLPMLVLPVNTPPERARRLDALASDLDHVLIRLEQAIHRQSKN